MNEAVRNRLLSAAVAIAAGAAGVTAHYASRPSAEVLLAMEVGAFYESSGRHIGTPYVDRLGKGQPLTVCNGVTGPDVVAGRYYTQEDCKRIELPKYLEAERTAKARFTYWGAYNQWVRASFIDMLYNMGPASLDSSTLLANANAGNLIGACEQMPRWVLGTVNGQKTRLPGLVDRRATTRELCAEWGRDGHFSTAGRAG
jgi:lysozyme